VEVRIHAFFLLLLALAIGVGTLMGWSNARVLTLWFLLLFAVVVREVARALAAAWYGLELRGILLLPTGGLMSYATLDATERAAQPAMQRRMAVVGPIASIGFGLPAFPLDGGRVFGGAPVDDKSDNKGNAQAAGAGAGLGVGLGAKLGGGRSWGRSAGFGQLIAVALVIMGLVLGSAWLTIMGAFILIAAHMENQGLLIQSDVDTVRMRDVMLTQFSTLSASDTLEDALQRAVHTLQDVFPVVRGGNLVGAVSRQNIVEALAANGNSYVQGVMTRSFQTALPDDSLVKTLRRIMGERGAQLVPVMEGERIVGIVTPQNLSQSMGLLNQSRRMKRTEES
jgi:CBS domain-containing protein